MDNDTTRIEREYHRRYLNDTTTANLIDAYRAWPTESVQRELERRGVTFWHYALTKIAD